MIEALPAKGEKLALPSVPVDPQVAEANIAKIKRMLRGEDETD